MNKKRTQAWWMIAGSLTFVIALLSAKVFVSPPPLCNPEVKSKTVVVLDYSEAVSAQTTAAIVDRTWQFIESSVADGERVSVFMLSQLSKKDLKPVFSACKPRHEGNRTIEDVRKVTKKFEESFKQPIRAELGKPIPGSDESPIAEGLVDLSLDSTNFRSSDTTKLIVFSDFIQHSPALSMYKCSDAAKAVKQFRDARIGQQERPVFRNVDIQMHIIPRNGMLRPAMQCRDQFWLWFFGDTTCKKGACLVPEYLPGN